jgi:ankyrin repeat protein
MVLALLEYNIDINAVCNDGDTALHYASAQGFLDIIKILVMRGANLYIKDKDGETPGDVAENK